MAGFDFVPGRYPTQPGCYLMRDASGEVLYVGKSNNLRRRLRSYFRPRQKSVRLRRLANRVAEVEIILLNNEIESFFLENNLIDHYRPPFNRALWRADRGYPYIALTGEEYPRLVAYRKNGPNRTLEGVPIRERFGPFLNNRFREVVQEFVSDYFNLRTCEPIPDGICLRYHLHRCSGICEKRQSREAYLEGVKQAMTFLAENQHLELVQEMKDRMWAHAGNLEFEIAQWWKDRIQDLENALEKQVVDREVDHDQDVVYVDGHYVLVARIKKGALLEMNTFGLSPGLQLDEALDQFLLVRYRSNCPAELIVNRLGTSGDLAGKLGEMNQYPVQVTLPGGGVEKELLEVCRVNLEYRVLEMDGLSAI